MAKWLVTIVTILWIAFQAGTIVHAAEHDDLPDHDTQHCVLCSSSDRLDDGALLPPVSSVCKIADIEANVDAFAAEILVRPADWSAPPGRAPPLS